LAHRGWRLFRTALSSIRLWPHLLLLATHRNRGVVLADIRRWCTVIFDDDAQHALVPAFLRLMSFHHEYRNLFYYRTGLPGRLLSPLCRPLPTLYITTPDIGPGLYIQHGFATIVSAARIGRDCWINQQVTIGHANCTDAPVLGDNVVVHAGAKVIGAVRVGDHVTIGANAVVVKDVPARTTVVGVPARIVRRNGQRVDEAL